MAKSKIQMGHQYGQTPTNVFSDFDWIFDNKQQLLEKYGECSIIVYEKKVIGVGNSYREALENAETNLPEDSDVITPVHQWIYKRRPFLRIKPMSKQDTEKTE